MTRDPFRQTERVATAALARTVNGRAQRICQECLGEDWVCVDAESLGVSHQEEDGLLTEAPSELAAQLLEERAAEEIHMRDGVVGRFKLLGELGMGGMGVVYLAHDPELRRKVAIKLVRPGTSETLTASAARARLMREAWAMAQISHPNVVAVHDVGTFGDQMFIAMDHVEGSTLSQWLSEQNRSWRDVLGIFIQAGRGLAAAHASGILHRDFKPENVLVDRCGRARVVDFGLALVRELGNREERNTADEQLRDRTNQGVQMTEFAPSADANTMVPRAMLGGGLTNGEKFVGTPAYMAPEQLMGKPVDEKTDQYSFCVALFQGLYGSLPFNADSLGELLERIRQSTANEIPNASCVPLSLHQAVLRGLSLNPADRFASMEVLLEKLELQLSCARRRALIGAGIIRIMSVIRAFFYNRHVEHVTNTDGGGLLNPLPARLD